MSGVIGSRVGRSVCPCCGKKGLGAARTEPEANGSVYQSRSCQYCGERQIHRPTPQIGPSE
jgi:hypothetical protein